MLKGFFWGVAKENKKCTLGLLHPIVLKKWTFHFDEIFDEILETQKNILDQHFFLILWIFMAKTDEIVH